MKSNSILQLKHVIWGSAGLVVVILLLLFAPGSEAHYARATAAGG